MLKSLLMLSTNLTKSVIVLLSITAYTMAYPTFKCAYEKDHNPPISQQAEAYFQQARALEKTNGWQDWPKIINLYEKAIALGTWKAMYNLAGKMPEYNYNGLPSSKYAMTQVMPTSFIAQFQYMNALIVPFYSTTTKGLYVRYAPRNPIPNSTPETARGLQGNVLIIDVSNYDQMIWT